MGDNCFFYTHSTPDVNPHLAQLQPYPFEKLRALFAGVTPNPQLKEIKLSIGEPQHATPQFIMDALSDGLKGLANYPTTQGTPILRQTIAAWCDRRYGLFLNPETEILPVNGSREALFSFAQTVIDPSKRLRTHRRQPQPLLPDLRRRGLPGRCRAALPEQPAGKRLRLRL